MNGYQEIIESNVEEGRRIGKNPWCASAECEDSAYAILNGYPPYIGEIKYPQEKSNDTILRRFRESGKSKKEVQTKKKELEREDREWKISCLYSSAREALNDLQKEGLYDEFMRKWLKDDSEYPFDRTNR